MTVASEISIRRAATSDRAAAERRRQGLPPGAVAELGIIGGSGLEAIDILSDVVEVRPATPYGLPSDTLLVGRIGPSRVAFLPRHGRAHQLTPTEVPFRANLYALKLLGAERVVGVAACGSMREEIAPRDLVVPDQVVDRTVHRASTFFGGGIVAHVAFADPFCPVLSERLATEGETALASSGSRVHRGGTYLNMEGPQFSSRAEAAIHRSWGVSVIGMTAATEAKLAREAELCYGLLAFATDYDVWHTSAEPVTVAQVLANLGANVTAAKQIVTALAQRPIDDERSGCACASALAGAIQTDLRRIDRERAQELYLLVGGEVAPSVPGVVDRS